MERDAWGRRAPAARRPVKEGLERRPVEVVELVVAHCVVHWRAALGQHTCDEVKRGLRLRSLHLESRTVATSVLTIDQVAQLRDEERLRRKRVPQRDGAPHLPERTPVVPRL